VSRIAAKGDFNATLNIESGMLIKKAASAGNYTINVGYFSVPFQVDVSTSFPPHRRMRTSVTAAKVKDFK
jgi:hypothetical protein